MKDAFGNFDGLKYVVSVLMFEWKVLKIYQKILTQTSNMSTKQKYKKLA